LPGFAWWSTGISGRSQVSEPKQQDKPFDISKWRVWEAYQRVKANRGAAGVDEQSIADFEQNLQGKSVQDLESDVVRELFPTSGEGGGDPEVRWPGCEGSRGADCRG
jgi:hypothetical protein